MTSRLYDLCTPEGRYDRAAIMRRAWTHSRAYKKSFASQLRSAWAKAKSEKQMQDEINRRAALSSEELAKVKYFDALADAYARPQLREFHEQLAHADSIDPWRVAA